MTSIRIQMGIIPVVAALWLAACGSSPPSGIASSPTSAALIHTASIKVGDKTLTVLKNEKGLTLYYFTPDTAIKVACTAGCASNWPPLLATSGTPTSNPALPGKLTVLNGANGNQVLYNGHPLYTYIADTAPGQAKGNGVNLSGGVWHEVTASGSAAPSASSGAGGY